MNEKINPCSCGEKSPELIEMPLNPLPLFYIHCPSCNKSSTPGLDPDPVIEEWNYENPIKE